MPEISTLADLRQLMIPELAMCPNPLIDQKIQQAHREFCRVSEAWKEKLDPIDLVEDEEHYTVSPSYDAHIVRVNKVWVRSETDVDNGDDGILQDESQWDFTVPDTLEFVTAPTTDVTEGLVVEVILLPYPNSTDIDSEFVNRYHEGIVGYAMWQLLRMKGKKWTDQNLAAVYRMQHEDVLASAMGQQRQDYKTGQIGMRA